MIVYYTFEFDVLSERLHSRGDVLPDLVARFSI